MDLQTLRVEHAVFLGCYTALILANSSIHRGTRGVRWFPVYSMSVFIGAVLVALRSKIPHALSVVGGDVFFSLGYVFLYRSLAGFFGLRSMRWALQICCVLLIFYAALRFGVFQPDARTLLMVFTIVLTAQLVPSAFLCFRHAKGTLRVSSALMGIVLTLLTLSNFLRFVGLLFSGLTARLMPEDLLISVTLLDNSVLQGAVTVAFVWMTAAALRYDLYLEASTDSLTGLLNRRAIMMAAEKEIAAGRQNVEQMTAILLDLDNFKNLNDKLGHQGGDAAIVAISRRLEEGMRKGDLLARLGGDEFVVLLPRTSLEVGLRRAEELRTSFVGAPVVYGGQEVAVTGSFGVAQVEGSRQGWKRLITACDVALYEAKAAGGNTVRSA